MDNIEFMRNLVPEFRKLDNTAYIENRFNMYKNYIEQSEIPVSHRFSIIQNPFQDWSTFRKGEVHDFVEDMSDYIDYEFNSIFSFPAYINTDLLSSYMIQNYLRHYFIGDKPIKRILYIDTPLLMDDLRRIIGLNSDEFSKVMVHNPETISSGVENYDFVIWDKMMNVRTEYERGELYRLLSVRHKKGLGNLFFVVGDKSDMVKRLSEQITDLMRGYGIVTVLK